MSRIVEEIEVDVPVRAEITEQRPDEVIAWRAVEGAQNDGLVRFDPVGPDRTLVTLQLDVEPTGAWRGRGGEA